MASIIPRPGGRHEIQLRVGESRHTIRLGKTSRRVAETVKARIEALAVARELGVEPDAEIVVWLDRTAGAKLRHRIARAGLAPERPNIADVGLKDFADGFLADYRAGTAGTKLSIGVAFARLLTHFGPDCLMRSITARQAEVCREALIEGGLAEASASTTVKKARQLWGEALKRGLVTKNVWLEVKTGSQDNAERSYYVSREIIDRVIAECPSAEWRLIIALSRYGGLRCPSEHLKLRRGDIMWDKDRFRVRGKGEKDRTMPIVPALRPYLEAAEASVKPSATYLVVNRRDVTAAAWRKQMLQWVAMAGLTPWPRLFHNLRASCETDLVADGHPLHVVGKWLGHSESIARRHYLQVTEAEFAKAANGKGEKGNRQKKKGAG